MCSSDLEAFNLFNHPSLLQPNNTVFVAPSGTNTTSAQAPGVGLNASAGRITNTTSDPRIVQLALKVTF